MLFPSEADSLGQLSNNIATDCLVEPQPPVHVGNRRQDGQAARRQTSPRHSGKQWTRRSVRSYSLFEIAVQAFKTASDPKDHDGRGAAAQDHEDHRNERPAGLHRRARSRASRIQTPVGGQWRPGTQFPWDMFLVDNIVQPEHPDNRRSAADQWLRRPSAWILCSVSSA